MEYFPRRSDLLRRGDESLMRVRRIIAHGGLDRFFVAIDVRFALCSACYIQTYHVRLTPSV